MADPLVSYFQTSCSSSPFPVAWYDEVKHTHRIGLVLSVISKVERLQSMRHAKMPSIPNVPTSPRPAFLDNPQLKVLVLTSDLSSEMSSVVAVLLMRFPLLFFFSFAHPRHSWKSKSTVPVTACLALLLSPCHLREKAHLKSNRHCHPQAPNTPLSLPLQHSLSVRSDFLQLPRAKRSLFCTGVSPAYQHRPLRHPVPGTARSRAHPPRTRIPGRVVRTTRRLSF